MAHYRIYLLDDDGAILSSSDADCPDDTSARAAARELLTSDPQPESWQAEIWQARRLLGRVSVTWYPGPGGPASGHAGWTPEQHGPAQTEATKIRGCDVTGENGSPCGRHERPGGRPPAPDGLERARAARFDGAPAGGDRSGPGLPGSALRADLQFRLTKPTGGDALSAPST